MTSKSAGVANSQDVAAVNADREEKNFLPDAVRGKIADRINDFVNIPIFLNEEEERRVFLKIVNALDGALYKFMPKEILELVNDPTRGVAEAVIKMMKENLAPILANAVPLPFIPHGIKTLVIEIFLNIVLDALAKGTGIDKVLDGLKRA